MSKEFTITGYREVVKTVQAENKRDACRIFLQENPDLKLEEEDEDFGIIGWDIESKLPIFFDDIWQHGEGNGLHLLAYDPEYGEVEGLPSIYKWDKDELT